MTPRSGTNELRRIALCAAGILIATAAIGLGTPGTVDASGGPAQVLVTNAASAPVPVLGSVDVTSLPPIELAPGNTVKVGNVVLVRTDTAPANPVHFPLAYSTSIPSYYVVPAGYRLVVENVSGRVAADPGHAITVSLYVGDEERQELTMIKQGNEDPIETKYYATSQTLRMYVEPEETITLVATSVSDAYFMVQGYLVPAP